MRDTTPNLLRIGLLADAAASGAMGLLLVLLPGTLSALFGLPAMLLAIVGLVCLGWAALTAWLGRQAAPAPRLVRTVIVLNAIWIADSLLLLVLGPALAGLAPTAPGTAFVLAQAAAVAGFTALQAIGLRRAAAPAFA